MLIQSCKQQLSLMASTLTRLLSNGARQSDVGTASHPVRKAPPEKKVKKSGAKRTIMKPSAPWVLLRRISLYTVAVGCGFLIAHTDVFKHFAIVSSNPGKISSSLVSSASPPHTTGPDQHNALFAAYPSWSQNFSNPDYTNLDSRSWNVIVGPAQNSNNEAQYYTGSQSNLRIENGALHLIATNDGRYSGYKYESARIETQGKQSFLYGRLDVTAKLPKGVGTWPSVWLLPDSDKYSNKSPTSDVLRYRNGGEIDIFEAVGYLPDTIFGIAHTLSDSTTHSDGTGSYNQVIVPDSTASYSVYTLLWTPDKLTFLVNGSEYFAYDRSKNADYTTWPFDVPFYLIANLAMGGSWGGQDQAQFPGNGIDNSALPASLDIQSIYYYPYIGK